MAHVSQFKVGQFVSPNDFHGLVGDPAVERAMIGTVVQVYEREGNVRVDWHRLVNYPYLGTTTHYLHSARYLDIVAVTTFELTVRTYINKELAHG